MARSIKRWIVAQFDRLAAKKVESEFEQSLASAGEKSGKAFLREMRAAFDKRMAELKVQLAKGLIDQKEFKKQADLAARAFNTGITKGMDEARKAGKLTDAEFLKLSRTLKRVGDDGDTLGSRLKRAFVGGAVGAAVTLGLSRLKQFLAESVQAAIEAEDSIVRLNAVLAPLGLSYAAVGQEVEGYLDRIQKTTRFSDEDAREALTNLVTATGDYRKSLTLLDVTAKIAEKRNTTMAAAAQTAADASKGLTKGMKDLGINAKDTGDIVAKIDRNLGNLAEEGATKGSGAIARMNNLWDEFKEKIGAAILGSDGLKSSLGEKGLLGALVALNDWADKNSGAISRFVDGIVSAGRAVAKVSEFIVKHTPNWYTLGKAIDFVRGKRRDLFDDIESGGSSTAKSPTGTGRPGGEGDPSEAAARIAAELEKVLNDAAVAKLQIERNFTEAEAREFLHREQILSGHIAKTKAGIAELRQAYEELDRQRRRLQQRGLVERAGIGEPGTTTPSVAVTPGGTPLRTPLADFPDFGEDAASRAKIAAHDFSSPWVDGLKLIAEEANLVENLFSGLGQAWAEGGIAWLAKFAVAKVKQNLAAALENAAMALGFSFINPGAASKAAAAAAGHAAAAAAWGGVAAFSGGGAGASSSSGGVAAAAPNLDRGQTAQQPSTEMHVYFTGPKAFSPQMQRVVTGNLVNGQKRDGKNVKVIYHGQG